MGAEQSAPDAAERLLQGAADWLSICRLGSIDSQMPRLVLLHMRAYASASIVEAHMTKMNIAAAASRLNVSVDSVRRRLRSGAIDGARDKAKAAAERDRFLTLIENLTRPAARA
jgi:hypothetical protein